MVDYEDDWVIHVLRMLVKSGRPPHTEDLALNVGFDALLEGKSEEEALTLFKMTNELSP